MPLKDIEIAALSDADRRNVEVIVKLVARAPEWRLLTRLVQAALSEGNSKRAVMIDAIGDEVRNVLRTHVPEN